MRHARGNPLERTEDFRVHVPGEHTPVSQPIAHILQEGSGATQIEVTALWHTNFLQQSCVNVPGSIEVCPDLVDYSGLLYTMYSRPRESCFSNERDSSANGWSARLRAP
jgi:hypothetical protein